MPKKTKKEKLIAEARRIIRETQVTSNQTNTTISVGGFNKATLSNTLQIPNSKGKSIASETDAIEFTAIRQDIFRTVLLAAIAVVIEIAFYIKLK
jgi:hypothetical protein